MQKILVTTDLSAESRRAFEAAIQLARVFNAQLLVLAVIEDLSQAAMLYAMDFPVLPDPDVQKQLLEKVKGEMKKLCSEEFKDIKVESFVREARGPVHTEILKFASEHNADLIVMATHGRAGLSRMIIGSVTEKVVRAAGCPVLTVPAKPG